MTELKEMGRRIQDAIKKKGLKQKFVAEQIGISEDSIGNYITGRREISAENLEKILYFEKYIHYKKQWSLRIIENLRINVSVLK